MHWNPSIELPGGGELRTSGPADARDLVLLAPGSATGTRHTARWSSNMNYLAPRLRRSLGAGARLVQVRYGTPHWKQVEHPIADVRRVLELEADTSPARRRIVLVGFSMGGATCLANADAEGVVGVVGIAPWLPHQLSTSLLEGRRLRVIHGSLDGELPLVPGLRATSARDAVARARRGGIDATFTSVAGGLHGLALPLGSALVPMPRARTYARLAVEAVAELLQPA